MAVESSMSSVDLHLCACDKRRAATDPSTPRLSVVAACFNEADCLEEFFRRVRSVCRELDIEYELVLVDDGSTDETWKKIEAFIDEGAPVVGVKLSRNFGQELAMTAGLHASRGDLVSLMDADLQDPPELLPEMLREIETGADVVYAQRRLRDGETWFKMSTAWGFHRLLERFGEVAVPRDTGNFRLMRRKVVDVLVSMPEGRRYTRGLVAWAGFKHVPVSFDRPARAAGVTKWPTNRMIALAVDAFISLSTQPLRLAWAFAFAASIIGIGAALGAIAAFIGGASGAGWALAALGLTAMLGFFQIACSAILGEYVARIYREVLQRPAFVVDRTIRNDRPSRTDRRLDA